MKIKYIFLLVSALLLINCESDDDDTPMINNEENLTEQLQQILEQSNFPGFTIGIVKNGNATYQKSFGFQNIEESKPYSNRTIQPTGSISKTFIGIATTKAIELGYFTLDTPINDILSNPIINPHNSTDEILVKHLVNHTSGLIDNDEVYLQTYYILNNQNTFPQGTALLNSYGIVERTPKTLDEFIQSYYYAGGDYYDVGNFINTTPGEVENYTNIGASLMAFLIQTASGLNYEEFLENYIFTPLQMNHTSFDYDLNNENLATLYFDKNTPLPKYGLESFPDGALKSSNEDMMKYLLDIIAGQRGESTLLFSQEYYELLFTETSPTYSVFWDIDSGDNAFGHGGSDPGLTTEIHFNGTFNVGFFLLSNYDSSTDTHEIHYDEVYDEITEVINEYLLN